MYFILVIHRFHVRLYLFKVQDVSSVITALREVDDIRAQAIEVLLYCKEFYWLFTVFLHLICTYGNRRTN